jgi:transposase
MKLYISGMNAENIQNATDIPASTITEWITKYQWVQLKEEAEEQITSKLTEKAIDDIAEYRSQTIKDLEELVEDVKSQIKLSKNPTSDKLHKVLQDYQTMILSLKGIQLNQTKTTVEHTGKISVKLEDLV